MVMEPLIIRTFPLGLEEEIVVVSGYFGDSTESLEIISEDISSIMNERVI